MTFQKGNDKNETNKTSLNEVGQRSGTKTIRTEILPARDPTVKKPNQNWPVCCLHYDVINWAWRYTHSRFYPSRNDPEHYRASWIYNHKRTSVSSSGCRCDALVRLCYVSNAPTHIVMKSISNKQEIKCFVCTQTYSNRSAMQCNK